MQQLFANESLAVLIAVTRRSIKRYAWDKLRPFHVTPQQCGVLLLLQNEKGMSLADLAGRIWCDNPTACRIVNKLVERGLVRSDSDTRDRRRFRLYLTDEGSMLSQTLNECANSIATVIQSGLNPEELETLRSLLRRVMENAQCATKRVAS